MEMDRRAPIESIHLLNRDIEPLIVQNSAARSRYLGNTYRPLQFVHCSDIHAVLELWNRMVEYINHYSAYIDFALHTGDYCGGHQGIYCDLYAEGTPCVRPILNCIGNHDTVSQAGREPQCVAHGLLFNHRENWGATFMEGEFSMAYFRDFPESNVRLIVLDVYYDAEHQKAWLRERLNEARAQGLHVVTAMHEPSAPITQPLDVTFQTLMDCGPGGVMPYEELIAEFIEQGGVHICNLAGHNHADYFGYTERGVLNIAVECGTSWPGWCDSKRVRGTRTYDCFNVMGVNVDEGIVKLVRVGDNADYFLRIKRALCYDYIRRKIIFNG